MNVRIFSSATGDPMLLGTIEALHRLRIELEEFARSENDLAIFAMDTSGDPSPYATFLNGMRIHKASGESRVAIAQDKWLEFYLNNKTLGELCSALQIEQDTDHRHLYTSPISLIIEADSNWPGWKIAPDAPEDTDKRSGRELEHSSPDIITAITSRIDEILAKLDQNHDTPDADYPLSQVIDIPLTITDKVLADLAQYRSADKFTDLPGDVPGERERATEIVNHLIDLVAAGVKDNPSKLWVMAQFLSALEPGRNEDTECREHIASHVETVMDILNIESSDGILGYCLE